MDERRFGVLIASSRFPDEPKLEPLRFPENDVDGFQTVLTAPDRGDFHELEVFKNKSRSEIIQKLNIIFNSAAKNDLILIYYSGHGKLNSVGRLHLTTIDTQISALEATSISMGAIRELVDISATPKVVMILDCCFSGAVGEEFLRSSVDDQLLLTSKARGTYIMTASTDIQVAKEKETDRHGLFTKHLIQGIRSGEADLDRDGRIGMDELYRYVHDRVLAEGAQQPMHWDLNVRGELHIASSGRTRRSERNRQLKTVLADLYKEERLHDDIFDKARKIIRLPPEKITGQLKDYDQLLDQLHDQSINPLDFVKAWYSLGVKVAGGAAAAQVKPELPEEPFPDAISTKKVATEKPSKEKATPVPSLKPQHSKAPWIIAAIICVLLAAIIFSWEQKTEPVLESVQQEPPKKITNSLGMTFVYIPPGTFTMGSPETEPGRNDNEKQQPVTLTQGFYLQTTEVTQEQWRAVMEENPAHFKACGDNCPVENVSWDDVQRFIKKLNGMSDGNTYRLPTEAEWEYAARAGSKTAFANGGIAELKCGHDPNLDAMGWYCSNSSVNYEGCFDASSYRGHKCAGTHPVGQKRLNDWGIYDMHGNVWEWCQDWYTKSPKGGTDPTGPPEGESRVIRGGSWNGPAGSCRAAYRGRGEPGFRFIGIGFRLALPPGQPK